MPTTRGPMRTGPSACPRKALADYDQAIRLDPELRDALHSRGCTFARLGEYQKALADLSEAIRLDRTRRPDQRLQRTRFGPWRRPIVAAGKYIIISTIATKPWGAFPFLRRRFSVKLGRLPGMWKLTSRWRFAMDGKTGTLHERWVKRTEAAYRRMFAGKSQEELVTLTQREDMAVLIAKELAAFLLEEHVALDSAAEPAEASTTCCPKCGQPGTPAVEEERGVAGAEGDDACRRDSRAASALVVCEVPDRFFFRSTFGCVWGRKAIARRCWRRRFVRRARRRRSRRRATTCGNWRIWRSARRICNG